MKEVFPQNRCEWDKKEKTGIELKVSLFQKGNADFSSTHQSKQNLGT